MFYDAAGNLRENYPGEFRAIYGNQQQPKPQQAGPTFPTIHAEIQQIKNRDVLDRVPINDGETKMFMLQDESAFLVMTGAHGGYDLDVYAKMPPERVRAKEYVTHEKMEKYIQAAISAALTAKEDEHGTV